jgi:hypothetical protein
MLKRIEKSDMSGKCQGLRIKCHLVSVTVWHEQTIAIVANEYEREQAWFRGVRHPFASERISMLGIVCHKVLRFALVDDAVINGYVLCLIL